MTDTSKVTRVEVIDHSTEIGSGQFGRVYVKWDDGIVVEESLQDEGRTLKIFISKRA